MLGGEVLYFILGNIVTWEWILQSNMIMGHTFFKMSNGLTINPAESLGGHLIYEDAGRCLFASSRCLPSLMQRAVVGITTLLLWIVYQHMTHWKRSLERRRDGSKP